MLACHTENNAKREGPDFPTTQGSASHSQNSPMIPRANRVGTGGSLQQGLTDSAQSTVRRVSGEQLLQWVRQGEQRGTIVNIWATWCGPCREELPMLQSEIARLAPAGLRLLLVSVDEPESEEKIPTMLSGYGIEPPYYVVERPLGKFKRALHPVWPGNIPVTFLFDGQGKRRYFWGGPIMAKELEPILEGFLAGRSIDGEARFQLAPGRTMD